MIVVNRPYHSLQIVWAIYRQLTSCCWSPCHSLALFGRNNAGSQCFICSSVSGPTPRKAVSQYLFSLIAVPLQAKSPQRKGLPLVTIRMLCGISFKVHRLASEMNRSSTNAGRQESTSPRHANLAVNSIRGNSAAVVCGLENDTPPVL